MNRRILSRSDLFWGVGIVILLLGCGTGIVRPEPEMTRQLERHEMVEFQLKEKGITNPEVLEAMQRVPRHRFVPQKQSEDAYGDFPLPIGLGQTISQPFIVAYMTQALNLNPSDRVLEIGTGSGYQAAILAELCQHVFTMEIVEPLGRQAQETLKELGYNNVTVRIGDGYQGWPEQAPFDAIILTAAPTHVPPPLLEQLKVGGRLILPVGDSAQTLVLYHRTNDGYSKTDLLPVAFVPLTGPSTP